MSLIVLNSKGDDPEDFSNFMTEQIKFPRDAEVCLVSSNINRRMMVDLEAQVAAGSNSLGFQLGSGALLQDGTRDGTLYTPHSPFEVNVESKDKNFPIKLVAQGVGDEINSHLNNPDKIGISNICRGWASAAAGVAPFTFWNTPQVCETQTEGDVGNWITQVGANRIAAGGINSTNQIGGTVEAEAGVYVEWKKLKGTNGNGMFVDQDPLWNTHNGATLGTFTPNGSNKNIEHGGYNWRFRTDNTTVPEIIALRGGIFDNTIFTSNDIYNVNSNTNKLNGGTAFTVWWEIIDPDAFPGLQVNFYARKPGRKTVEGVNNKMDGETINWARASLAPAPNQHINLGIRPVIDATGATPVYCLEAYYGVTDLVNNTWTTLPIACTLDGTAGKIIIADPANQATWTTDPATGSLINFDLYRHLPIRMGLSSSHTEPRVLCNAIHHKNTLPAAMSGGDLANFSPYTFLLNNLSPVQNALPEAQGGTWDRECRQILRKSTVGKVLGYVGHYGKVAATAMPPAAAGLPADLDLGLTRPEALNLVVTLPDLPITGYYGNSSGDGASGTLNLNSGGNSAAILGVIPCGNRPFKQPALVQNQTNQRGEFFACPMENWICLNNPAPFSVSSLRCRLTDALGNKPDILDSTSTITIKIKKRNSDNDYSQGGNASVFH
jgi:hypothetical protein